MITQLRRKSGRIQRGLAQGRAPDANEDGAGRLARRDSGVHVSPHQSTGRGYVRGTRTGRRRGLRAPAGGRARCTGSLAGDPPTLARCHDVGEQLGCKALPRHGAAPFPPFVSGNS